MNEKDAFEWCVNSLKEEHYDEQSMVESEILFCMGKMGWEQPAANPNSMLSPLEQVINKRCTYVQ